MTDVAQSIKSNVYNFIVDSALFTCALEVKQQYLNNYKELHEKPTQIVSCYNYQCCNWSRWIHFPLEKFSTMDIFKGVLFLLYCLLIQTNTGETVETVAKDLMVTNVERTIDVASQLVKINTKLTLSNEGQSTLKFFHFTIEDSAYTKISYIGVSVRD